ncbi:hypothetical protein C1H76_5878 [Elsinoe australis]|uniref:Uncharacterized protein n=1 Tax=Elsinoe australis TaxID=40998 RepID=A0A4U7AXL1_9PEZI|nr:hypothetical protein C1H76_5878 [Elsinoe australis]
MASNAEDDLTPEQTEGFKVGEKKTIDEYQKLAHDRGFLLRLVLDFARGRQTFAI